MDLQLPVQSELITTKVVSLNLIHGEVYLIQHNVIKFVSDLRQVGGFLWALRFPLPRYNLNIVESGIKHHKTNKTNKQTESDFVNAVHTDVKSEVDMSSHKM